MHLLDKLLTLLKEPGVVGTIAKMRGVVLISAFLLVGYEAYQGGTAVTILTVASTAVWFWFFCIKRASADLTVIGFTFCTALLYAAAFKGIGEALDSSFWAISGHVPLLYCFLRAGLVEELAKFGAMYFTLSYLFSWSHLKTPADVVAVAAAAALGFAGYETFSKLHYLHAWTSSYAVYSVLVGVLGRIPLHVLFAALWGAAIGFGRYLPETSYRPILLLVGLGAAMFLHGLWDLMAFFFLKDYVIAASMLCFYVGLWGFYFGLARLSGSAPHGAAELP